MDSNHPLLVKLFCLIGRHNYWHIAEGLMVCRACNRSHPDVGR